MDFKITRREWEVTVTRAQGDDWPDFPASPGLGAMHAMRGDVPEGRRPVAERPASLDGLLDYLAGHGEQDSPAEAEVIRLCAENDRIAALLEADGAAVTDRGYGEFGGGVGWMAEITYTRDGKVFELMLGMPAEKNGEGT